jgi:hypothetical protein
MKVIIRKSAQTTWAVLTQRRTRGNGGKFMEPLRQRERGSTAASRLVEGGIYLRYAAIGLNQKSSKAHGLNTAGQTP